MHMVKKLADGNAYQHDTREICSGEPYMDSSTILAVMPKTT
jgi:hypothetical protein